MAYALCLALIAIGLYGALVKKNVVKIVISLAIVAYGINILLALVGYRLGGGAPILKPGMDVAAFAAGTVDPLPQALIMTAIMINLGMLILMVALCIRLYERYGTFDVAEMRKLKG